MGSSASTNNFERKVQIGYRPVGGRVAAWTVGVIHTLLKRSSQMPLKEELPDPHYHWCVLVGEYYHQIQITDDLLWYENCEVSWSKSHLPRLSGFCSFGGFLFSGGGGGDFYPSPTQDEILGGSGTTSKTLTLDAFISRLMACFWWWNIVTDKARQRTVGRFSKSERPDSTMLRL